MLDSFDDYMITGGMPKIVSKFIESGNFSGILSDYEEDITKYAFGLDQTKIIKT